MNRVGTLGHARPISREKLLGHLKGNTQKDNKKVRKKCV